MDGITFASLLNAAGAGIAAVIITSLVQLLKTAFPGLANRASGASMAFVLSGILYVVAAVATSVSSFDTGLNVFLAWLTCAVAAVGTYATVQHGASRLSSKGD